MTDNGLEIYRCLENKLLNCGVASIITYQRLTSLFAFHNILFLKRNDSSQSFLPSYTSNGGGATSKNPRWILKLSNGG